MGILDFIKKLRKQPEKIEKTLSLRELEEKLEQQREKEEKGIEKELERIQARLETEKKNIKEALQTLEKAKVSNKHYPERVKHIMEGNRKTYIQKITNFTEQINLPEKEVKEYTTTFTTALDELTKNTLRNYKILTQFFNNEITTVVGILKIMDELVQKTTQNTSQIKLDKTRALQEQVKELQKRQEEKKKREEAVKQTKKELHEQTNTIQEAEKSLETLKKGKDYESYIQLTKEKEEKKEQVKEHKKQLTDMFSAILPALKKYERLTLEQTLIQKYLENPQEALEQDKGLVLAEELPKMKQAIQEHKLELKTGKKEKIVQLLTTLTKDYFEKYQEREKRLEEENKKIEEEIRKKEVVKEIEQQEEEVKKRKEKEEQLIKIIRENQEKEGKIKTEEEIKKLQEEMKEYLQKEITIKL